MNAAPHTGLTTAEYYHQMALLAGHRSPYTTDLLPSVAATAGAGSASALHMEYLQAMDSTRFSSPRLPSRPSRKRPLPISPLSEHSFDLQTMIRNSPNSLVTMLNNSRSSSSTSGSYGHLSAGAISPALSFAYPSNPSGFARAPAADRPPTGHRGLCFWPQSAPHPPPTGLYHPKARTWHPPLRPQRQRTLSHLQRLLAGESGGGRQDARAIHHHKLPSTAQNVPAANNKGLTKPTSESAVSSTGDPMHHKRSKMKPEEELPSPGAVSVQDHPDGMTLVKEEGDKDESKQEPEVVYETNCHWENCCREFDTQEQLVQHINNDHIHGEKKEFVCRWEECSREQKPFKAQYMLVVHMRRHTGEKPHKCTVRIALFTADVKLFYVLRACAKAYSRLENLKTHLRSHTGEKPYVCEHEGCNKAFSNASDRAKHQNRTHSNEKPYVCKIPGCTKRYTDPSSLRKHVKTVHGPEAHVTKKQRGDYPRPPPQPREPGGNGQGRSPGQLPLGGYTDQREYNHATSKQDECLQVKSIKTEKPMTSQPSPGGQSTCSSDQSPISTYPSSGVQLAVSAGRSPGEGLEKNEEKEENEEEADEECEGEPAPIMDSTVSTGNHGHADPAGEAKCRPPSALDGAHQDGEAEAGSCLGRQWGVPAPQPPVHAELGSTELTVLNLLRDRRDSSGSNTSSAYLSSSRRSSGISPCFSSRRSSQASQSEGMMAASHHRRLHNLSSTDSYDPISTDASRRSSEASQYGAQHYHLKAKYAAATGGPPPTPLPNMERMSLKTRMAMVDEGGSNNSLPPLVRPHRCSEGTNGYTNGYMGHSGYRRRVLYPGEGPLNGNRRASDPVRTQAPDICNLPPVQRFNSLNNLHPLPPLSHHSTPETRNFSLQNYTRSEGNLQRGLQHSPYTPSIAEHAALEALAMEDDSEAGLLLGDEDMLPDDLVQYLHSQVQVDGGSYMHIEDQIASSQRDNSHPSMEEIEQIQTSGLNMAFSGSHNLQTHQVVERKSPSKLPIQWNEVSSGSADRSPQREQNHQTQCGRWSGSEHGSVSVPFGRFGNMVVQQQVPLDFQNSCAQANQSQSSCCVNPVVKLETTPNSCMEMRGTGHNSTNTFGRPNFSQIIDGPLPQGFKQQASNGPQKQSHFQQNHNGSTSCHVGNNLVLSRVSMDNLPSLSQGTALHHNRQVHVPRPPINSYRNLVRTQQYLENSSEIQASLNQQQQLQRSGDHCSLAHQVSGLKLEAPDHGYLEQGFGDCLSYEPADHKASSFPVLEDQCLLDSMAEPVGQGGGSGSGNSVALLSPGADQVTSTVDGNVPVVLDEGVSLDFGAILEDGFDQGSLVSGVLSPSIFQGLSRTSSRLTTPRASAAFHSVAPGLNNMAIGDMSSLLTTLAEESKFLAIMQ
ncbi:Transcriptional activator GLI3 [Larimichthys crocea]|uniref:Uncharacterized protein n=1 Tax=Larimichthys crocea TaxID=215358 RepID=A0ACD3QQ98_LARCR|nr:Transcriptional activator GLI3 [Larimichthys crocea]